MKSLSMVMFCFCYLASIVLSACTDARSDSERQWDDDVSGDSDSDSDGDSDGDSDSDSDSDGDSDGDSDSDSDSDGDSDSDADSWKRPCDEYPDGPYNWSLEHVVSGVKFPAIYGADGDETMLDMCEVYKNHKETKSLIFASLSDEGCACCLVLLVLIGDNYDQITKYNSEVVAIYIEPLADGTSLSPSRVTEEMEQYNWAHGWRIQDVDQEIWTGGCYDECLFQENVVFFVVDTATMRIVSRNPIGFEDMIEVIKQIDEENP